MSRSQPDEQIGSAYQARVWGARAAGATSLKDTIFTWYLQGFRTVWNETTYQDKLVVFNSQYQIYYEKKQFLHKMQPKQTPRVFNR